ncbi:MAG: hypothetical protein KGM43_19380 [Planctomycetota bacterium]|nr:hypothetical protein [Planctomycetota bacterium]
MPTRKRRHDCQTSRPSGGSGRRARRPLGCEALEPRLLLDGKPGDLNFLLDMSRLGAFPTPPPAEILQALARLNNAADASTTVLDPTLPGSSATDANANANDAANSAADSSANRTTPRAGDGLISAEATPGLLLAAGSAPSYQGSSSNMAATAVSNVVYGPVAPPQVIEPMPGDVPPDAAPPSEMGPPPAGEAPRELQQLQYVAPVQFGDPAVFDVPFDGRTSMITLGVSLQSPAGVPSPEGFKVNLVGNGGQTLWSGYVKGTRFNANLHFQGSMAPTASTMYLDIQTLLATSAATTAAAAAGSGASTLTILGGAWGFVPAGSAAGQASSDSVTSLDVAAGSDGSAGTSTSELSIAIGVEATADEGGTAESTLVITIGGGNVIQSVAVGPQPMRSAAPLGGFLASENPTPLVDGRVDVAGNLDRVSADALAIDIQLASGNLEQVEHSLADGENLLNDPRGPGGAPLAGARLVGFERDAAAVADASEVPATIAPIANDASEDAGVEAGAVTVDAAIELGVAVDRDGAPIRSRRRAPLTAGFALAFAFSLGLVLPDVANAFRSVPRPRGRRRGQGRNSGLAV